MTKTSSKVVTPDDFAATIAARTGAIAPHEVGHNADVDPLKDESAILASGWRLVIAPRQPMRKTASGIELAGQSIENQQHLTHVGLVVNMGPAAFKDPVFKAPFAAEVEAAGFTPGTPEYIEELHRRAAWCQIGDWIVYGRYAGQNFEINGNMYRVINDRDVLGKAPDPVGIKIYIDR